VAGDSLTYSALREGQFNPEGRIMNTSTQAYDEAQQMILSGKDQDDVEMHLVKTYPDLNAQGLIPTILRRAHRDLAGL
jgi:hypothetical protein